MPIVDGMPLGTGLEPASTLTRPWSLPGVSLEATCYTLLLLISLTIRFWRFDDRALDPNETRIALAALEVARGSRFPSEAGALLGFGNALVFAIAGATDMTARFLPALLGGLIPLALLPARAQIGGPAALIAAALLTFSALLLDQSRTVGSAAIAATISVALVFTLFTFATTRRPRDLYWAAFLLALALTAGAAAFSTLIALGAFGVHALITHARAKPLPRDVDEAIAALAPANGHAPRAPMPDADLARARRAEPLRAAGLFLGTLVIVGTGALIDPGGIGEGLFAPLGAWFAAFDPMARHLPGWIGPLTLLAYEPLAIVLGAAGAYAALRSTRPLHRFLVLWLGVALVVAMASPDRGAALLVPALLPAYVLGGVLLQRLIATVWPAQRIAYLAALGVVVWGAWLLGLGIGQASLLDAVGVRYVASAAGMTEDTVRNIMMALPAAMLVGALVYLSRRLGPTGRPSLALAALTALLGFNVHAAWNLAYQIADNTAELPHLTQSSVDLRTLAEDADHVMQVLTINRKERTFVLHESMRYPVGWYLREQPIRYDSRVNPTTAVLVLPEGQKPPSARFAAQLYRATVRSEPRFENAAQFWRWLIYRESSAPIESQHVNLFVRAQ